jgi:S1-C subfamily serine protease
MLQTCRTILFFGLLPCSGRKALLMANKGWNFSDEARFSLSITVPKLTAALSGLLLAACSGQQASLEDRVINVESDAIPTSASPAPDMSGLLRQTSPSYVTITIAEARRQGRPGDGDAGEAVTSGSGFIVDDLGHVLTAGHVAVKSGYSVTARGADGRLYSGRVVAIRPNNDMALIALKGLNGKPVEPASSPCMPRGASVFSLGKPHAQGDTARLGQVESMSFGRAVSYNGFGYPDAMVLRMNTKKGESGGPVFNGSGQLTGMVVSTLSDGNGRPLNLAHAVPSSSLADFLCSQVTCSARWQSLVGQSTQSCRPNSS